MSGTDNGNQAQPQMTVLTVEDDPGLNQLIQKRLQRLGLMTIGALNGKEALKQALSHPDLILLVDYKLSDMTAQEFLAALRARSCELPFIVMTAHGDEKIAVEMMKLGARDYIIKSADFLELLPSIINKVVRDVQSQQKLAAAEERFTELFETIRSGVIVLGVSENEFMIEGMNKSGEIIENRKRYEVIGKRLSEVFPKMLENDLFDLICRVWQTGKTEYRNEVAFKNEKNELSWREYWIYKLSTGEIVVIFRDITERKNFERELIDRESRTRELAEENARLLAQAQKDAQTKTALLHEVNHRVKNNLSSIIGLLYAEKRFAAGKRDAAYRMILNDLAHRIQGLAMVHDMLCAAEWAPLKLDELTSRIIHSMHPILPKSKLIQEQISPSPVHISPKQANSFALIINELTTNTIKYALKNRSTAQIKVSISNQHNRIRFVFQDDGPGFPEFVLRNKKFNTGLFLVQTIIRNDLQGELALSNENGAAATIEFDLDLKF